tara:strand:- start:848 stop:1171 length:324 start_codon:yes stop_codon:yes gene_type:complete
MEDFIVSDLLRINGVINAALLDDEGFILAIANSEIQVTKDIEKIADIDLDNKGYSRITITSEKAILIIDKLDSDNRLITWCEQSCNLGMIRKNLDNAVLRLNSYLGN